MKNYFWFQVKMTTSDSNVNESQRFRWNLEDFDKGTCEEKFGFEDNEKDNDANRLFFRGDNVTNNNSPIASTSPVSVPTIINRTSNERNHVFRRKKSEVASNVNSLFERLPAMRRSYSAGSATLPSPGILAATLTSAGTSDPLDSSLE